MYCHECGKKVNSSGKYCNFCGNLLEKEEIKNSIHKKCNTLKKISIYSIIITLILSIINYFYEIDIIYHIIYGDVSDFFEVLFNTIIVCIPTIIMGMCLRKIVKLNLKETRKLVIMGLVSNVVVIFLYFLNCFWYTEVTEKFIFMNGFFTRQLLSNLSTVGLLIYFSTILLRLNKRNINIKFANFSLILSYVAELVILIIRMENALEIIINIILIIYFINILILKKESKILNNNILAISIIIPVAINIINSPLDFSSIFISSLRTINISISIIQIFIIPYFYNYYNLVTKKISEQ